jgi:AcrR family transcriptional regulator
VGLRKPTLYHYVGGKGEILYGIHAQLIDTLQAGLQRRLDAGVGSTENLFEVMCDILDIVDTQPGHLRVYFENERNIPESYREQSRIERDRYFEAIVSVIQDGMDRGELRATDARVVALALFGMCNWSYQWYRPGGAMSSRQLAEFLWNLFLNGAANPGSGSTR